MTRRIRWYRVEAAPAVLARLIEGITRAKFRRNDDEGFVVETASKNRVAAVYLERQVLRTVIEDPFGGTQTYERTEYRRTVFRLGPELPHLEIFDPPRTVRPLLS